MHGPLWMWIRYSVMAVVLGAALAAPAAAATPDAWITTKIKLALLTTEGVSGTAIKVDTVVGQVTLYGKVHSAEEQAKAEDIARKVDGVQNVRNLLQVVAPEHEKAMQVSDDDLKQRVEQALQADPSLKSSNIAVQSVNQGVVLLSGTAKILSAHLRAVEDAAAVPGVRRVASEIQSPDTLADEEILARAHAAAAPAGLRSLGHGQRHMDHLGREDELDSRWQRSGTRNRPRLMGRGGDAVRDRVLAGRESRR